MKIGAQKISGTPWKASLPARSKAGFTMIEIALALGVIAFALVAIIGVLPIGMDVQKNNREETIINFDAKYLMDAIRSGSLGQDELTNYIVSITNNFQTFVITGTAPNLKTNPIVPFGQNWYNSFTNINGQIYSLSGQTHTTPFLTNGANIIGLLTTPKYIWSGGSVFTSNSITADFRAITGSPTEQGTSSSSRDVAFTYRLFLEVVPFGVSDPNAMNIPLALNLQNNLMDIRMRFRWPVLPSGNLGNGSETYRTSASGSMRRTNIVVNTGPSVPLYYFQSQTYSNANVNALLLP